MSRPVCDLCSVKHEVVGSSRPMVRCSKHGERWAPMVEAACSDLRIDGLQVLAKVSGLGRPAVDEILAKVRANSKILDACPLHDFEPTSDKFGAKHRCKSCGGEVESLHASWYRKGLRHASESELKGSPLQTGRAGE